QPLLRLVVKGIDLLPFRRFVGVEVCHSARLACQHPIPMSDALRRLPDRRQTFLHCLPAEASIDAELKSPAKQRPQFVHPLFTAAKRFRTARSGAMDAVTQILPLGLDVLHDGLMDRDERIAHRGQSPLPSSFSV